MSRRISFQNLFNLSLHHGYYRDGVARTLRLIPTPTTQHVMGCMDIRMRQEPGEFSLWQGAEGPREPVLADAVFGFYLHSDDPQFMTLTQATWPDPALDASRLLYLSNRDIAAQQVQDFDVASMTQLITARGRIQLPQSVIPGTKLHLARWWNDTTLWSGTVPSNRKLTLPEIPVGRYTFLSSTINIPVCSVTQRPQGRIGFLELGMPGTNLPDPIQANLRFDAKSVHWEYEIRRRDLNLPLQNSDIYHVDGPIAFDPVPPDATSDANTRRFRSHRALTLNEMPPPEHRFELRIPEFGMKHLEPIPLPAAGPSTLRYDGDKQLAVMQVVI